ncbi:MAG TPA: stage 0 sporulation family protein [Chloroflexi bacterium]|nr:stage 0 sporulation family protein [Chloroflexota bacterium]
MSQNSSSSSYVSEPIGRVASVRFRPTGKPYDFDASECPDLQAGDFVLVETARGQQLGEVVNVYPLADGDRENLKPVQRRATGRDLALNQQLRGKEQEALNAARSIATRLGLPIKIVLTEYTFDGQRLTLSYVGEDKKLNVGRLQHQLQQQLGVRVDLHRIGPRDHAKLLDGYGACGEPRCCARFITEFCPVSIKMAKTQGISLNPSDITGMCGRLRCCLVYEQEQYQEASQKMPRRKRRVQTPYGEGKVIDLLPLRDIVVVQVEDRRVEVPTEDVEVISKSRGQARMTERCW